MLLALDETSGMHKMNRKALFFYHLGELDGAYEREAVKRPTEMIVVVVKRGGALPTKACAYCRLVKRSTGQFSELQSFVHSPSFTDSYLE